MSKHSEPIIPFRKKNLIVITQASNTNNKGALLTYNNGDFSFRYNMSQNANKMNTDIINKTINYIKKTYEKENTDSSLKRIKKLKLTTKTIYNTGNEAELSERTVLDDNKKNSLNNESYSSKQYNNIQIFKNSMKLSTNSLNDKNSNTELKLDLNFNSRNAVNKIEVIPPSSITIYQKCTICNRTFLKHKMLCAKVCEHFICKKCAKNYYEDRIEQGTNKLKCPVMRCNAYYDLLSLNYIISENHFNIASNAQKKTFYNSNKNSLIRSLQSQSPNLQIYSQKHVIEINSNENFYKYKQSKTEYCPFCHQQALFGKTGTHFVKCLNCFHCICKYCMKEYDETHLDINMNEHCKVFYRIDKSKIFNKKCNMFCNALVQLGLVIICYLLIYGGLFRVIQMNMRKVFRKKKIICKVIIYIVSIILFLICVPLLLVMLPYFPVFIAIFG